MKMHVYYRYDRISCHEVVVCRRSPHDRSVRREVSVNNRCWDKQHYMTYYTPCLKKTVQTYFLSELCQILTECENFGTKIAKRTCFSEVYSLSTSPNLCQFMLSLCQKFPKSVKIWQSSNKNMFAQFFRHGVNVKNLTVLKLGVWTTWRTWTSKTAKIKK